MTKEELINKLTGMDIKTILTWAIIIFAAITIIHFAFKYSWIILIGLVGYFGYKYYYKKDETERTE